MKSLAEGFVSRLLSDVAGVKIGGTNQWDVVVHDKRTYLRVLLHGTLGVGESYMAGWWDTPQLDQLIYRLLVSDIKSRVPVDFSLWSSMARSVLFNLQRIKIFEVGEKHYDAGNDLYRRMLDKRMIYSCGYWKNAQTLDEAQEHKLDLICRKVGLEKGMRILDIGCGWGGFLKYAAENFGVEGVGVTISREQQVLAQDACAGLPVDIRLEDYLELDGQFDRIVSIGMFEHVGVKNYRTYFQKVRELLSGDGLFLLHTIGGNLSQTHGDPWSEKYIFPNGMLPSQKQIGEATEGLLVMEDWHNFGADYDKTLMAWHDNFEQAWPELSGSYGETFHRMWRYYLLSFAAIFRARITHLWQIVYSKDGVPSGYTSLR